MCSLISFDYDFSSAKISFGAMLFRNIFNRDENSKNLLKFCIKAEIYINEFNIIIQNKKFKIVKSPLFSKSIMQFNIKQ